MRGFLVSALLLCATPAMADSVYLTITFATEPGKPDVSRSFKEESLEQCWKDAAEFVAHDPPESVRNEFVGIGATCARVLPRENGS